VKLNPADFDRYWLTLRPDRSNGFIERAPEGPAHLRAFFESAHPIKH